MRGIRKLLALALVLMAVCSPAVAQTPSDALTKRSDSGIYSAIHVQDLGSFLAWLCSKENLNIISKFSNGGLDAVTAEILYSALSNIQVADSAFIAGNETGKPADFFIQAAFTLKAGNDELIQKFASGQADGLDAAKLLIGDNPLNTILASMLKVEFDAGVYKIDNVVYLGVTPEKMFLLASSKDELNKSLNAIGGKDRFLESFARKFNSKDFLFAHLDYKAVQKLDENDKDLEKVAKYFDEPLNIELGFDTLPDKFVVNMFSNFKAALADEYAGKIKNVQPVKGGYMNLDAVGGSESPLLLFSGIINTDALKDEDFFKDFIKELRFVRSFGITEDDLIKLLNGAFTFAINDSVPFQGFKIPAFFVSQTNENAPSVFKKLAGVKYFNELKDNHSAWEKLLQLDNSISPISCLIGNTENNLGLAISEASSLNAKPVLKPALQKIADQDSTGLIWLDFEGVQKWLNDNGAIQSLALLAMLGGLGEQFGAFTEVINAKFSVPYFAFTSKGDDTAKLEFGLSDVEAGQGFLSKLADAYAKYADK